jgi:hypothetical protein
VAVVLNTWYRRLVECSFDSFIPYLFHKFIGAFNATTLSMYY